MIQASVINGIAQGVVGWRQPTRSGSPVVTAANIASSSGLYYQDGSALCTVDNIKAAVDDEAISDANLNTVLADMSKSALNKVCADVFNADDFIDGGLLFKHENKFSEVLTNTTDFVGFEIDLSKRNDISVIINNILLEFDAEDSVKVLLFNSQSNAVVSSSTITTVANSQKNTSVRWVLNDLAYGGKFYIGYLRGSLTGQAVKRNYELASVQTSFDGVEIRPVRVADWSAETMFNPEDVSYESDTWGMNFNISVYRDFTEIVKANVNRFADALQLQVCAQAIDMISNSTRSNRAERLSKANAVMELNGNRFNPNFPEHTGVRQRLAREIRRLKDTYTPTGMMRMTLR